MKKNFVLEKKKTLVFLEKEKERKREKKRNLIIEIWQTS
jgi:hypothetical protein